MFLYGIECFLIDQVWYWDDDDFVDWFQYFGFGVFVEFMFVDIGVLGQDVVKLIDVLMFIVVGEDVVVVEMIYDGFDVYRV